jgi:hypothetical protein
MIRRVRYAFALTLSLSVIIFSAPSSAKGQVDVRVASRSGVVVRANPSADAAVVETLQSMAKVTVLEQLGSWLRVATSSRVGYVKASDLSASTVSKPPVTPVVSVLEAPAVPLYQTTSGQVIAGYKDPGTATLFSVVLTGGGHFYSGESKKGAMLLGIGLGSFVVGAAASTASCDGYSCSTNTTPLVLGALAYMGTWVYGIMDAGDAARRHNASVGLRTVGANVMLRQLSAGRTGIGLSIMSGN